MKLNFRLPNTRFCFVLWYRNNTPHNTRIATPANSDTLRNEMIKHRVGASEIRAVKADPSSGLRDVSQVNTGALAFAMTHV